MIRLTVSRNNIVRALFLALSFAVGFAFHKYGSEAFHRYVHVSALDFVKSPRVYLRGQPHEHRDRSKILQYTQDRDTVNFRHYVETGLLPIDIDGKRLSDFYPVPKMGGAITVVDKAVIILDRLGGLYHYDMTTGFFEPLRTPPLPNNLEAYLQRAGSRTHSNPTDEFRAHGITFLSDRKELAVAYDKFDVALGALRTAVSVIPINSTTLAATGAWQQIFISDAYLPGFTASGGRMAYRGDGKLYLALGEHCISECKASQSKPSQDPDTTNGMIIEIDIPVSKWRVFTKDHKNHQGLTFLKSGQLVSADHDPRSGDELNVITEGGNYGWRNVMPGTQYRGFDWNGSPSLVGSKALLFAWSPSIAVSQLIEMSNFHPRWDGDLLVASSTASSLYRLRLEAGRVLYSEPIWIGQSVRDLAQTKDGTIVLWTDDSRLLFVRVDRDELAQKRTLTDAIGGATLYNCMICHHFGSTNLNDPAPSLSNLLNRRIASDTFRYSSGLRAKDGTWTEARLVEFLSDPAKFANGTNMPNPELDREAIKDIVNALVQVSASSSAPGASQ